jgi:hypothetical protein
MPIVTPQLPVNLFSAQALRAPSGQLEQQDSLRPNQIVSATVVSSGQERLLELNQQYFKVNTEIVLQAGQKLLLQVVQTEPQLELNILPPEQGERLAQLLPLLTRSFDWQGLIRDSAKLMDNQPLVRQLGQILNFAGQYPDPVRQEVAQLAQQLVVAFPSVARGEGALQPASATALTALLAPTIRSQTGAYQGPSQPPSPEHFLPFTRLLQSLDAQLAKLSQGLGSVAPQRWHEETRDLLSQFNALPKPAAALQPQIATLLGKMQQHPAVSAQLAQDVRQLLTRLGPAEALPGDIPAGAKYRFAATLVPGSQPGVGAAPGLVASVGAPAGDTPAGATYRSAATLMPGSQSGVGTAPGVVVPSGAPLPVAQAPETATASAGEAPVAKLENRIQRILQRLQPLLEQKQSLSPELVGRLEGLLERIKPLEALRSAAELPSPELVTALTQLVQTARQMSSPPDGKALGGLSQFFGLHMERELQEGRLKDALANLKAALLKQSQDGGEEMKEPLRRIELFQLCKARLADEAMVFMPLPFAELEEGYLLAEQGTAAEEDVAAPLQLSISLRLSALGNLRVDMLYDRQGLQLRLASESQEKMDYIKGAQEELRAVLQSVPLQGIGFAADARAPASQLSERLNPAATNLLDERI